MGSYLLVVGLVLGVELCVRRREVDVVLFTPVLVALFVLGVKPEEFPDRLVLGEDADVLDWPAFGVVPAAFFGAAVAFTDLMDGDDDWFSLLELNV